MQKLFPFLLPLIVLTSCNPRTPRDFFNRPAIKECITLIQDGASIGQMACNGKILDIPSRMTIIQDQENIELLKTYYDNREYGHWKCLKYPSRCKK